MNKDFDEISIATVRLAPNAPANCANTSTRHTHTYTPSTATCTLHIVTYCTSSASVGAFSAYGAHFDDVVEINRFSARLGEEVEADVWVGVRGWGGA